jgi:sulfate permease, SulP family
MTGPRRCGTVPGVAEHRRLRLPLFTSLRGYDTAWLRGDAIAGLTVWAVLVPEALA